MCESAASNSRTMPASSDPRRATAELVTRVALGREHLAVGASEELSGGGAVGREDGPADRGIDLDDAAVDPVRAAEGVAEPADENRGLLLGARADGEDDELVAADARDGVARAHDGLEPARDALQDLIAGVVPADVVDLLESVEVDGHQREGVRCAAGPLQRLVDAVVEQRSVREPRQRVPERQRLGRPGPVREPEGCGGRNRHRDEEHHRRRPRGSTRASPLRRR